MSEKIEVGRWIYWRYCGDRSFHLDRLQDVVETRLGQVFELTGYSWNTKKPFIVLVKEIDYFYQEEQP